MSFEMQPIKRSEEKPEFRSFALTNPEESKKLDDELLAHLEDSQPQQLSSENKAFLDSYHRAKRQGEFPTPLTSSIGIIAGIGGSGLVATILGNWGVLSAIPLTIAGGALGYFLDKRESKKRLKQLSEQNPLNKLS